MQQPEPRRRFNLTGVVLTLLFAMACIAIGLFYIIAKPTFGGRFDCAMVDGRLSDCNKPGLIWWGPAGLTPIICASFAIIFIVVLWFLRWYQKPVMDIITVGVSSVVSVAAVAAALFFFFRCCCYPKVRGERVSCIDGGNCFPCWMIW